MISLISLLSNKLLIFSIGGKPQRSHHSSVDNNSFVNDSHYEFARHTLCFWMQIITDKHTALAKQHLLWIESEDDTCRLYIYIIYFIIIWFFRLTGIYCYAMILLFLIQETMVLNNNVSKQHWQQVIYYLLCPKHNFLRKTTTLQHFTKIINT